MLHRNWSLPRTIRVVPLTTCVQEPLELVRAEERAVHAVVEADGREVLFRSTLMAVR
jgi:hypothetical protein